jgi:long-chain acyl-CoA synthetase
MPAASEIANIFQSLPTRFQKGAVDKPRTFYFSLDEDEKWTVSLSKDACQVTPGKPAADADCFFKASKQMFLDVWNGKYVPSAKDFLMGTIKSNNPLLLKDFVAAFKKG